MTLCKQTGVPGIAQQAIGRRTLVARMENTINSDKDGDLHTLLLQKTHIHQLIKCNQSLGALMMLF